MYYFFFLSWRFIFLHTRKICLFFKNILFLFLKSGEFFFIYLFFYCLWSSFNKAFLYLYHIFLICFLIYFLHLLPILFYELLNRDFEIKFNCVLFCCSAKFSLYAKNARVFNMTTPWFSKSCKIKTGLLYGFNRCLKVNLIIFINKILTFFSICLLLL